MIPIATSMRRARKAFLRAPTRHRLCRRIRPRRRGPDGRRLPETSPVFPTTFQRRRSSSSSPTSSRLPRRSVSSIRQARQFRFHHQRRQGLLRRKRNRYEESSIANLSELQTAVKTAFCPRSRRAVHRKRQLHRFRHAELYRRRYSQGVPVYCERIPGCRRRIRENRRRLCAAWQTGCRDGA